MIIARILLIPILSSLWTTTINAHETSLRDAFCKVVVSEIAKLALDKDGRSTYPVTIEFGLNNPLSTDAKACVQLGLKSAGVDATYQSPVAGRTHVSVDGVVIDGDSASAHFTYGSLPTSGRRGGITGSILLFSRSQGTWTLHEIRPGKMIQLCEVGGCK